MSAQSDLREDRERTRRRVKRLQQVIVELMLFRSIAARAGQPHSDATYTLAKLHAELDEAKREDEFARQRLMFSMRRQKAVGPA